METESQALETAARSLMDLSTDAVAKADLGREVGVVLRAVDKSIHELEGSPREIGDDIKNQLKNFQESLVTPQLKRREGLEAHVKIDIT